MIANRRSAAFVVVCVLSLAVGCKSDARKAYERVAHDANPLLLAMRPAALTLMAATGDDPAATAKIIETCTSADHALSQLRHVRFDSRNASISQYAGDLLDERDLHCPPDLDDGSRTCRDSCLEQWRMLVAEVATLRAAAAEEGVDIVSLSP